jgi:hydroxybutyrate-dimer hydrolase
MRRLLSSVAVGLLVACGGSANRMTPRIGGIVAPQRVTEHRDNDDLLTAGLGLEGLRSVVAPAFADAANPTAAELRRRAIWSSWRGIADLSPTGGFGEVYGSVAAVPGRELGAFLTLPGASQPQRVLLQVPDTFDLAHRCLVVAPSSGSRGIYGAIAVAGPWALPRGCAIVFTDKGAGSDYFDLDSDTGVRLDGTRAARGADALAFTPSAGGHGVAVKHAHSGDNPEAAWGKDVLQAVEFALAALHHLFPEAGPFDADATRVIAVGISNGGGAVLRAAEVTGDWLDGVVAAEPNIYGDGGKPLYDYATQAALLMPCALLHFPVSAVPRGPPESLWKARCASLQAAGILTGDSVTAQAHAAHGILQAAGFTDDAMIAGAAVTTFDLWRAIAVTYASAYSRTGAADQPCGYSFAVLDAGKPRPATDQERAIWFSDATGIPPGTGVAMVDSKASPVDPPFPGLLCLRDLSTSPAITKSVAATHAALPRAGLPVVVIHGTSDGLVPEAFSSLPYVKAAKAAGRIVTHWRVENAQHFDAFIALPGYSDHYVPMLPYVYNALDKLWAHLDGTTPMPADAVVGAKPRGGAGLDAAQLALPQ